MPNIEIKAKCNNVDHARDTANRLKTEYIGELHQIDTYFTTERGRLKLREVNGREAQLIPYFKEYSTGPMKSSYSVLPVEDVENVKSIFNEILGIITVVDKKREVFLIDNVRVHLDQVENLGSFIEFEAVYEDRSTKDKEVEVRKVEELMDAFKIKNEDLMDKSYIDYLLSKDDVFKNLKILYSFENDSFIISEIERRDVDKACSPDKRYFWMLYDKLSKELNRLDFISMESETSLEKRAFSQAKLEFTLTEARFFDDRGMHTLPSQQVLGDQYKDAVLDYFKELPR